MKRSNPAVRQGENYPTFVELNGPEDGNRAQTERYVRLCFKRMYGADIRKFMPVLMSLRNDDGRLLGTLGFKTAQEGPLFLEQYLDRPVEQVLASKINRPVDRGGLVEVGNLAVSVSGGGRWLITALTAYLHSAGAKWVVFTVGPALRNSFARLGIELLDLGPAELDCLPSEERSCWGSYYDQKPRVMAGYVPQGHEVMQQRCESESALMRLWLHAGEKGSLAA
jgi:hypothetical protein